MQEQLFYVNNDCPGACFEEHAEPTPDYDGQWRCPETDNVYTRDDGAWVLQTGRYPHESYYVALAGVVGEWFIDPTDHGWESCWDCGHWVDADDIRYNDYGSYCVDCYTSSESDDDDYSTETPHTATVRCEHCDNARPITHWDPITEEVSCGTCAIGEPVPSLSTVLVAA